MAEIHDDFQLKLKQLRSSGQAAMGFLVELPGRPTVNIDAILQAADVIQAEDPNVSRILCEQAYSMAQNLDQESDGRGVLQFNTGLMSVIKQKLAKIDGGQIDWNPDIEHLWGFLPAIQARA